MQTKIKTTSEVFGLDFTRSKFVYSDDLANWFEAEYKIHELLNDFWGLNTKSRLIAVSKDIDDNAWKGLVSEWDAGTRINGQFRLNRDLIQGLLEFSLGEGLKEFKLKDITQLELAIFENLFVELENYWKDFWKLTTPGFHGSFIYLIWAIELENNTIGSLAIGVPPGLIPKHLKEKKAINFKTIASNLEIEVPLDLSLGKTRLKISEIRNLEAEDIVFLEDSDTDYLTWKKNDLDQLHINIELPKKDNPNFTNSYYDEIEIGEGMPNTMSEENNLTDDLLTDLPVELTAQFKSVYMPLHKIIELESGGILPLGLLMDSELTLVAPGNKPIASGNLVIVGNQFGIKINKTNLKGSYPKAKLNMHALETHGSMPKSAPRAQVNPEPQDYNFQENANYDDAGLDQELEDIGIDPKELDELEDLY